MRYPNPTIMACLAWLGAGLAACDGSAPAAGLDAPGALVDALTQKDSQGGQDTPSPADSRAPGDVPGTADSARPADAGHDAPSVPMDLAVAPPRDSSGAPDAGAYRSSLATCWTDAKCKRVMAVAHGGAWDLLNKPYDSNAAISAAYTLGIDGVKIDVRVTKDNIPVIAHSSPIELYESLDCYKKKIEQMTAAQVVKCHRFPSLTETFQRLDDVLKYLRGKMVTQLCVKEATDLARVIAELHAQKAEDFAFIELASTSDLQKVIPTITGSSSVWYLVNVRSKVAEVDTIVSKIKNPRAFMVEFDPGVAVSTVTSTKLHPANVRSFTYTSSPVASVKQLKALFDGGFDVVSAQTAANVVQARIQVNKARGVSPP